MAVRPVFMVSESGNMYKEEKLEFMFYSGFSISQKQKSVKSLHDAFQKKYPNKLILEVSTKSNEELGIKLSAFNLKINTGDRRYTLENVFQAGKIFNYGGPYTDLLDVSPYECKRDERLKNSGNIIGFKYMNMEFPTEPKTFFYDYIYVSALNENKALWNELFKYDAFTDIEFNPNRSINCQARSCAIFVTLYKRNLLEAALRSPKDFKDIVYKKNDIEQMGFL